MYVCACVCVWILRPKQLVIFVFEYSVMAVKYSFLHFQIIMMRTTIDNTHLIWISNTLNNMYMHCQQCSLRLPAANKLQIRCSHDMKRPGKF